MGTFYTSFICTHFFPIQVLITLIAHESSKKMSISLTRYFEAFSPAGWVGVATLAAISAVVVQLCSPLSVPSSIALVASLLIFQRDFQIGRGGRGGRGGGGSPAAAARAALLTTCLFSLAVFAAYSALLTATMIGRQSELDLATWDDVAGDPDVRLIVWEDTVISMSLEMAPPDSPLGRVHRRKIAGRPEEEVFVGSNEEVHERLSADPGRSVYVDWDTILAVYPDLYAVRSFRDYTVAKISICFQKNSEYTEAFNYQLRKLDQSGIRLKTTLPVDL